MTKINYQGKLVEAEEVKSIIIKEDWNEYKLSDDTILRVKIVVANVYRLNTYDQDGNPIYVIKSTNVMSVSVPTKLKKE